MTSDADTICFDSRIGGKKLPILTLHPTTDYQHGSHLVTGFCFNGFIFRLDLCSGKHKALYFYSPYFFDEQVLLQSSMRAILNEIQHNYPEYVIIQLMRAAANFAQHSCHASTLVRLEQ